VVIQVPYLIGEKIKLSIITIDHPVPEPVIMIGTGIWNNESSFLSGRIFIDKELRTGRILILLKNCDGIIDHNKTRFEFSILDLSEHGIAEEKQDTVIFLIVPAGVGNGEYAIPSEPTGFSLKHSRPFGSGCHCIAKFFLYNRFSLALLFCINPTGLHEQKDRQHLE